MAKLIQKSQPAVDIIGSQSSVTRISENMKGIGWLTKKKKNTLRTRKAVKYHDIRFKAMGIRNRKIKQKKKMVETGVFVFDKTVIIKTE